MAITITHAKTNAIADWTQAQLDAIIAGNPAPLPPAGTTLDEVTLPSDWNADHVIEGLDDEYARLDGTNQPFTGPVAAPDFNGVALTNAGSASNFLAEDGEYYPVSETDTLQSVTDRGATTTKAIGLNVTPEATRFHTKESAYDYKPITGTIVSVTVSVHDVNITGSGTSFLTELKKGDILVHPTLSYAKVIITNVTSNTACSGISSGYLSGSYGTTGWRKLLPSLIQEDFNGKRYYAANTRITSPLTGTEIVPTHLIDGDVLIQNYWNPNFGLYIRTSAVDGRMRIGHINSVSYIQLQQGNAAITLDTVVLSGLCLWTTPQLCGTTNGSNDVRLAMVKTGNGANQTIQAYTQRYAVNGDAPKYQLAANGLDFGRVAGTNWFDTLDAITLSMGKASGNWKFGNFGTSTPAEATSKIHIVMTNGYEQLRLETPYTPSGSGDTNGNTGQICWDDSAIHVKTSTGWKAASFGSGGGAVDSVNGETGAVVLTTGDIAEDTDKNYVTDADLVVLGNTSGINTGDQDLSPYATTAAVAAGYQPLPEVYTLASNASTAANTTPINLTDMVFNYEADSTYKIELIGAVSSAAATTGYGFHLDLSSAVTSIWLTGGSQLANTGTYTQFSQIASGANVGVTTGVPTLNTAVPVEAKGLLITTTNTGTAQLRFRSEVAAVTTCLAGTTMIITKIG